MLVNRFKRLQSYIATRVKLGGIFPNDGYITAIAKTIEKDFSSVQSGAGAPGAVTDLHTFTVPAGCLKVGDFFDVYYGGSFNTNDNNKNLIVDFGIANVETTGLIDIDDLGWQIMIRYGIQSTTVVSYALTLIGGLVQADSTPALAGGFGGRCVSRGGTFAVNNIDTNSQVLKVKGQGTALGDVTKTVAEIKLTRF